jgi:hypothetical protein
MRYCSYSRVRVPLFKNNPEEDHESSVWHWRYAVTEVTIQWLKRVTTRRPYPLDAAGLCGVSSFHSIAREPECKTVQVQGDNRLNTPVSHLSRYPY